MREHNKYYWDKRQQRSAAAHLHTDEVSKKYADEIAHSIKRSRIYGVGPLLNQPTVTYKVVEDDSVSAIMKYAEGVTAVLNFASFKNPGGKFLEGSRAQEESLCHESTLYNILKEFPEYYQWNSQHVNRGLYMNRAIYSPDVVFERDGQVVKCDVITCASPNWSAARDYGRVYAEDNKRALESRIRFILQTAKDNNVDTLILGAFGCGVFQQDPDVVAKLFHECAEEVFCNTNVTLIFAIIPALPGQTDNLTPFKNEFKNA